MIPRKLLAMLALPIGTVACATSPIRAPFLSHQPSPPPVAVPPAECTEDAPERAPFVTPVLPPAPTPERDPLGGTTDPAAIARASREDLAASRMHFLMRAARAEPLAASALDHIADDNVADRSQDDLTNRCAAERRQYRDALAAWSDAQREH